MYELACEGLCGTAGTRGIDKSEPEYQEAKRLLKFLDYFIAGARMRVFRLIASEEFNGGRLFLLL